MNVLFLYQPGDLESGTKRALDPVWLWNYPRFKALQPSRTRLSYIFCMMRRNEGLSAKSCWLFRQKHSNSDLNWSIDRDTRFATLCPPPSHPWCRSRMSAAPALQWVSHNRYFPSVEHLSQQSFALVQVSGAAGFCHLLHNSLRCFLGIKMMSFAWTPLWPKLECFSRLSPALPKTSGSALLGRRRRHAWARVSACRQCSQKSGRCCDLVSLFFVVKRFKIIEDRIRVRFRFLFRQGV